ncbi:hypothetical protein NKI46_28685 [Mesorhizobium sp. M0615]|uniref:hypothetical protein n=1 Tax=Mesorhizobium sp. M0615 TaxID=2956971 RepID=UPI003335E95D
MKSHLIVCAIFAVSLGGTPALADDAAPAKDTVVAGKIIGNGRAPDNPECKDNKSGADCQKPKTEAIVEAPAKAKAALVSK